MTTHRTSDGTTRQVVPDMPAPRMQAGGLTVRDQFAMAALPLLASRRWDHVGDDRAIVEAWASAAYAFADAMLQRRES